MTATIHAACTDLHMAMPVTIALAMGAAALPYAFAGSDRHGIVPVTVALTAGCVVATALADHACRACLRARDRNVAAWYLAAAICFSMCAGLAAASLIPTTQPAVVGVLGLACGGCMNAAVMFAFVRHPRVRGAAGACMLMLLLMALGCAATIYCDLPPALLAALGVCAGAWGAQMMANLVVRVPDGYLLQWRRHMTRRWTVRGDIPDDARILTDADLRGDLQWFLARYAAGIIGCTVCMGLSFAALTQTVDYSVRMHRIALLTTGIALALYLALKPRQSGRPFERHLMRGVAVAVWMLLMTRMPAVLPELGAHTVFATLAVNGVMALGLGFGMIAQHSGLRSLALSRTADILCVTALCVTPLAALASAGLVEWVRGLV